MDIFKILIAQTKILFQSSNLVDNILKFIYNYRKGRNMEPYSVEEFGKYLQRKMMLSRIIGIIGCLVGITSLVVYALQSSNIIGEVISDWMLLIMITYSMGVAFTSNSGLQGIKVGNPWQRLNAICAIFFYFMVVFLIGYGFASGNLYIKF